MHILFPYLARYKAINWTRYHHLFGQLAESGHRITVLQPPPAELGETNFQDIEVELPENIRLHDVPMPDWFWRRSWPLDKLMKKGFYGLRVSGEVERILAEDPPDALLVYNLPQAGLLRLTPPFGHKLVRVFDLADDYEAMLVTELGRFAYRPLIAQGRRTLHRMLEDADLVLSISRSLADEYPDRGIELLPNGVDFSRFDAVHAGLPQQTDGNPVIGYLGAFEYFIDFDLILETAKRLPGYRFRLVGSGRDLEAVKRRVREENLANVELPGPVPFDRVPEEIGRMDICLNLFARIPISHRACPMKLFEYLAMGRPVLTTTLDEIESYGVDFLATVNDPDEAAATITRLIEMPEERQRRAELGRDWVQRSFDWRQLANRFVEMVEQTADCMS